MHVYIAVYKYIYSIYALERCVQYLHNAFIPRKLVHATPGRHSYSVAQFKFYAKGCRSSLATLPYGKIAEQTLLQVTK